MIRRTFWLTLGAVLGVAAYRRLAALGRSVPAPLRVKELTRFASDVREGMALYANRHPRQAASNLEEHGSHGHTNGRLPGPGFRTDDVKDGR